MDIFELKSRFPKTYAAVFALGVQAARKRALASDLIANSEPGAVHPAVFTLAGSQNAPGAKSERLRSPWVTAP
jgi:hypothetical protein